MKKSNLIFKNYRVEEIKFNFNIEKLNKEEIEVKKDNMKVEIGVGENDKEFAVKITYDEKHIHNCYDLKVVLIGQFEIKENSKESINDYAPNAVVILFPYLRSTITSITSASGLPPLMLPIINFSIN